MAPTTRALPLAAAATILASLAARARADDAAPARIVLVDEGPFRGPRPHVRSAPRGTGKASHRGRPSHPAPRIVVDVDEAEGGTSAADLQRAARNFGYWPFRRCYEAGLRHSQRLSGRVLLDVTVAETGAVQSAVVSATTLADDSVALCVAREAQHLPFAATDADTHAILSVSLWTGDEPVPVPPPVPHAAELREGLRALWPALGECYQRGLATRPTAGGPMDLHFRVSADGAVLDVSERGEPPFADADVTRCVLAVCRAARLPATPAETTFDYSVQFESAADPPVSWTAERGSLTANVHPVR